MTKELTPLEALQQVKATICIKGGISGYELAYIDVIEQALKDYEKKTKLAKEYADVNNVAKRLKAFEIIKAKPQTLYLIPTYDNYHAYLELAQDIALIEEIYSPEEFELLKEVML